MCGIAGLLLPDADASRLADAERVVRRMNALQSHRGPDDDGVYASPGVVLGHRRLSILDLSPRGHQPMNLAGSPLWIVHNGEVYNYVELRRELEAVGRVFASDTDTEVVLAAYAQWGESCLARFNGMFAFAIWNDREKTLFCARDRFGIKPFHYTARGDGSFAFASEIKALHALSDLEMEIDEDAAAHYVAHGFVNTGAETFVRDVRSLLPGHCTARRLGEQGKSRAYWDVRASLRSAPAPAPEEAAREFRSLLEDSVRLRLRSDVPVGTGERAERPRQATFSACFDDPRVDERPFMREISARTRTQSHEVFPGAEDLDRELGDLIWQQDEPFGSTSIFAQRCVFRRAREAGVPVTLDGQGADELLGGYVRYPYTYLAELSLAGEHLRRWGEGWRFARLQGIPLRRVLRNARRARASVRGELAAGKYLHARLHRQGIAPGDLAGADPCPHGLLREHLVRDLTSRMLPSLLRHADRNSMTFSVESRVPFLDHRVVEFVFGLPSHLLFRDGWTKRILRDAFADVLPAKITWRRDKIGFAPPEDGWFRGSMGERFEALLANPNAEVFERFVDYDAVRRAWERFAGGGGYRTIFWRTFNLQLWMDGFLRPAPERLAAATAQPVPGGPAS